MRCINRKRYSTHLGIGFTGVAYRYADNTMIEDVQFKNIDFGHIAMDLVGLFSVIDSGNVYVLSLLISVPSIVLLNLL